MDLRQKIGQLLMIQVPGTRLTEETATYIRECHPAGVALFGPNIAGPWATAQLVADLQAVARRWPCYSGRHRPWAGCRCAWLP